MLTFLLYCDLSTMPCTAADINTELSTFAKSYVQVNDSLWFFRYTADFDGSFLPKEEHLFYDHFDKFTTDDSTIFIEILQNKYFYNLPDAVHEYLTQD